MTHKRTDKISYGMNEHYLRIDPVIKFIPQDIGRGGLQTTKPVFSPVSITNDLKIEDPILNAAIQDNRPYLLNGRQSQLVIFRKSTNRNQKD